MSKLRDVCIKYREELFGDIEKGLCLKHYNMLFKTDFKEDEVKRDKTQCFLCNIGSTLEGRGHPVDAELAMSEPAGELWSCRKATEGGYQ